MEEKQIARKLYYSIREVCAETGLEPHVLRYWESEFSQLRPKKNRAGNRAYRAKDIDLIRYIRHLLYDEKYTIAGARRKLVEGRKGEIPAHEEAECCESTLLQEAGSVPDQTHLVQPAVTTLPEAEQQLHPDIKSPDTAIKVASVQAVIRDLQDLLRSLRS